MKRINIKGPIVTSGSKWMYDWLGMPACSPGDIEKALAEAGGEDVTLVINSNGGVAVAGFEIYAMLMEYEGKVTAHIVGAAMSAASIIACAADKILASDASVFMIHNTLSYAEGDYRDMQMEADALREFNESIINVYVRRTKKSREELQELMDHNTYMSAQKAIENGFVDDFMFGNPEELVVVNSEAPVFTEEMVRKFAIALKRQDDSGNADSDIQKKEGKEGEKKMTLEEFLEKNPEEKAKVDKMASDARQQGITEERGRLRDLDKIAHSVSANDLEDAKYGENPKDAKTLAYEAMVDDTKKCAAYMKNAVADSEESGAVDVGSPAPEDEEESSKKDADFLAGYVNTAKGKKV